MRATDGKALRSEGLKSFGSLLFLIKLDYVSAGCHQAQAVATADQILRKTFRRSDLIKEIPPDQFAVFARSVSAQAIDKISARVISKLDSYARTSKHEFELSWTVSVLPLSPSEDARILERRISNLRFIQLHPRAN
jgi:hypothetical protein